MSFLNDLPSQGYFQGSPEKFVLKSKSDCEAPKYLAFHDSKAPEPQLITTDKTNILIRSLLLRRQRQAEEESGLTSIHAHEPYDSDRQPQSSGKKRSSEGAQQPSESRKRAHIQSASVAGEAMASTFGEVGGGYTVAMGGSACRSIECSESFSGIAFPSPGPSVQERMGMQDLAEADVSMDDRMLDSAEPAHTTSSKACPDDMEAPSDEEDKDDIFRPREERERADGRAPGLGTAAPSPETAKIAVCKQTGDKCKQMSAPQANTERLLHKMLGCSQ